jgi:DUF1680 family protein
MKRSIGRLSALLTSVLLSASCGRKTPAMIDYPVQPVPLAQVEIMDTFWAPKQEVNRTVSLQHCIQEYEERGRLGIEDRLLEASAYMIAKRRDPAFEEYIKTRVETNIERRLASPPQRPGSNPAMRAGGMSAEAAVAYFEATGDRRLLDAAIKAADVAVETVGPGKQAYISGHEGQKIGLIRLFRGTGDDRYWKLARFLLDIRGRAEYQTQTSGEYPGEREYNQNHLPVVEQTEAVGHAVRATYLYIPLTDIAALTGRPEYAKASDLIWQDVVGRKMYLTGGIGSVRQQEKFGSAYELPNVSAWHETCASYGNIVWNHRLFLLHRDGKYVDTMERILYNGFLAGVSLKGDRFFYQNVLMSYGNYERFDWINVPCCPPNVVRLMASIGSYIYAKAGDEIYVNLFVGSKGAVKLDGNTVHITQETRYPWEGKVRMTVEPEKTGKFSVLVRIPEWARNTPLPSDLYRYNDPTDEKPVLSLNGSAVEYELENGYARLERRWKAGDVIELNLPMPVHKVLARDKVRDDRNRVSIERGPLVFCAEWPDNGGKALNIVVPDGAKLTSEFRPDLLNGIQVVTGRVSAVVRGEDGVSKKTVPHDLTAIPYYAWANRGMGEMTVWLPRDESEARLKPVPPAPVVKVASFAGIEPAWTGYGDQNDDLCAVYDGVDPMNSADESHLYFRMRPPVKKPAWIEYAFKAPTEVSSSAAYFADDRRFCRLPAAWRVVYKDGNSWKPVANKEPYTVDKDKFNAVTFVPVKTTAIRIEVEPQSILYKGGAAGPPAAMTIKEDTIWREFGIIEWRVK